MNKHLGDTKTERVSRELLKLIVEEEMQPGDMMPSEGKIAERFGVSKMTSKLALNDLMDKDIIYRVPRQGSFLKEIQMSRLKEMLEESEVSISAPLRNPCVALILPKVDLYTGQIIKELSVLADERNYQLLVKVSDGDSDKENEILKEISGISNVRGVFFFPGDKNVIGHELINYKMRHYPIVMIDRVYRELQFDSVSHDHYQGSKDIVRYLINKGHRRIGFVSYDISEITSRDERYKGYIAAMMEANCHVQGEYVLIRDFDKEQQALNDYLDKNKDLTAIFCADDYLALRLYYAAVQLNIQIPSDLSVVGFTDNEILTDLNIPLTTVRQPVKALANKAFEILIGKIDGSEEDIRVDKIPTEIVERQSVATLKS